MRLQELMMILFSFSTVTTSVMQLGEHEWLMYLSITDIINEVNRLILNY